MAHSHITAGLCALVLSAIGAPGALAQEDASSIAYTEASRLLALRAHEGLPVETYMGFMLRLDDCARDETTCAPLLAELTRHPADRDDAAAPLRLIRGTASLLPGSDGEIEGNAAESAVVSAPQQVDTFAPVLQSFAIRKDSLIIDQGETTVTFDYEITDEGGSYLDYLQIYIQGKSEGALGHLTLVTEELSGSRAVGTVSAELPAYIPGGTYTVYISITDNAGNNGWDHERPTLTLSNANGDSTPPVLEEIRITPDPLVMTGEDAELAVEYQITDPGLAGLDTIFLILIPAAINNPNAAVLQVVVYADGEATKRGRAIMNIPAHIRQGLYYLDLVASDAAGNLLVVNASDVSDTGQVQIENPYEDTQPPIANHLIINPDVVESSGLGATLRVEYALEDRGGSGLDFMWVTLDHETLTYGNYLLIGPRIEFRNTSSAVGGYNWSIPPGFPPGAYHVTAWIEDEVRNRHPRSTGLSTTQIIWVNEPGTRAFGPFPDVIEPDGEGRDIFRISGLQSGPPQQIEVAFRDPEIFGFDGAFSDCALDIRPERHSGAEYLILAPDLAACGAFGSADLVFRVTPQAGDLDERILLRRFRLSETGMLTDMAVDRAPLSRWTEDREEVVFGPFEWTETPSTGRLHQFRLSGLYRDIPQSMDIAIANAAVDGFDGAFTDCTLDIPLSEVTYGVYAFTVADLAACGDFGRADLSFRFTDIARVGEPVTLTRLVTTADGSVSDISFDQLTDYPLQPEAISGGRARIEAGPFEWTGDSTAPTRNLFRISGLDGVPGEIEVAINNAAASGYDGAYTDCSLTIRPERAGAHDYLITASDLTDCGDFGRADLSFRITAPEAALVNGARMRRIAIGAYGDLTDFNFDHDRRDAPQIRESSNNQSNVVLGPFEWTGDQTVGTQNVFRITGINGAPTRIQAALADATNGDFAGSYLDCELTVRPERVSNGDFVITSNDLADCGDFARANVTFRVFANTGQFSDTVRMRRFAVTRTGGLTDFGFDNQ